MGQGVVGLDELAWRQSGVVPYRISGRRWENTSGASAQLMRGANEYLQHGDSKTVFC